MDWSVSQSSESRRCEQNATSSSLISLSPICCFVCSQCLSHFSKSFNAIGLWVCIFAYSLPYEISFSRKVSALKKL
ncbi:hypothetical protein B4U80_00124 [Leptotrombidium deliense]|uniref:Uncharacterized protein n=1 Tax=Leptotrombidium deliense TaxID=299467 RepID=A0A443SKU9_9ACAR|nr:hypothetical protein B4U80_00124 [Leptotrombidium deliense]